MCRFPLLGESQLQLPDKVAIASETIISPRIDGKVDKIWLDAKEYTGFIQREPEQRQPASNDTKFYVMYDRSNIYFLFIMIEQNSVSIPARLVDRDYEFYPDDNISFFLDTYNDQRKAFLFSTNPCGVEHDGLVSENGDKVDMTWDTIFEVAAQVNSFGWIAEFSIPFKSLRFKDNEPYQIWGFNVWRVRKQSREITYWSLVDQNYQMIRLDKGGALIGMKSIDSGRNLNLLPYVTVRNINSSDLDIGNKIEENEINPGLDLKYSVTSDLTFDLTINPDFGQVEIDEEQINVDKRYEIQLEEKRPFFIENTNLFQSPYYQLFYSRRIGLESDIKAGAKLTGKLGSWSIGALGAYTGEWEDYGLGDHYEPPTDELFSIFRLQRDIFASSNFGFLYVDRMGNPRNKDEREFNRAAGIDWSIYHNRYYFNGQGAYSYNSYDDLKGGAGYVQGGYYGQSFWADIHATYIEPDFNIDKIGYFPKVPGKGTQQAGLYTDIHPFINRKYIRSWGWSIQPTILKDSDEKEIGWGIKSTAWIETPDQSQLKIGFTRYRDVESDIYYWIFRDNQGDELIYWGSDLYAELTTDIGKPISLYLKGNYDRQYYFQTHDTGYNRGIKASLKLKPLSNLYFEIGHESRQFLNDKGELRSVNKVGQSFAKIYNCRMRYLFTKNLFTRGFFQWTNSADEFIQTETGFYEYAVWERISGNVLIGWRFIKGSTAYFAYTEEWDKYETQGFYSANRILFFKISYWWSL